MIASEIAKESIRAHEGLRLLMYQDTVGKWTVGYGHNIEERGISPDVAEDMLEEDVEIAESDAIDVYGDLWANLSVNRQAVLIEMSFQLGRNRLSGFQKFLAASRAGDHDDAAREMMSSQWAVQVPKRAKTLSERYLLG